MIKMNPKAAVLAQDLRNVGLAWHLTRFVIIARCAFFYGAVAHADLQRTRCMGCTPWLDDLNLEAADANYVNSHSNIISRHLEDGVRWTEAPANESYHRNMMWECEHPWPKSSKCQEVFLSILPLNPSRAGLGDYRGAAIHIAMPESFIGKRFDDPGVKQAYLSYAESTINFFEPGFLTIAIEANELVFNTSLEWQDFVELYIETYAALKLVHPESPVFFTNFLHTLDQRRGNTEDAWSAMSLLWNYAYIAAFSYYLFMQYPLHMSHPVAFLDSAREHAEKSLSISESGYPPERIYLHALGHIPAIETLQALVLFRMLIQDYLDEYVFYAVWDRRDFDQLMNTLDPLACRLLWRDTGLLSETGEKRSSPILWDAFYNLPTN